MLWYYGTRVSAAHGDYWNDGFWYSVPELIPDGNSWDPPSPVCKMSANSTDTLTALCPLGWTVLMPAATHSWGAVCFKRQLPVTRFDLAKQVCRDDGGSLTSITSVFENQAVMSVCGARMCWIGFSRSASRWSWLDGSEVELLNWHEGEPDDANDEEHYAIMNMDPDMETASFFGFLFFVGFIGIIVGCLCGNCAIGFAHVRRQSMLVRARQGERVSAPNEVWRYCCGASAIYYWEGCSGMCWMSCFCGHCCGSALCCWSPTDRPLEGGSPVGPPVMIAQHATTYGHPGVAMGTGVGHPGPPMQAWGASAPITVTGQPVIGYAVATSK